MKPILNGAIKYNVISPITNLEGTDCTSGCIFLLPRAEVTFLTSLLSQLQPQLVILLGYSACFTSNCLITSPCASI